MKLSQLVKFKQLLSELSVRHSADIAHSELGDIVQRVAGYELQFGEFTPRLMDNFDRVNREFSAFQGTVDDLLEDITEVIASQESRYFANSYDLYRDLMPHETDEYILNRRFGEITEDVYNFLHSRIHKYDSWQHAGMIIRPGLETFIDSMVACDPMYLVDIRHELLQPTLDRFQDPYRRRLRPYVVKEEQDQPILGKLPDGQFGFVLAYNIFNFRPFEMIGKYLTEIYQKLRPGGTLAMTYNNCDLAHGVVLTELNYMCYTPGRLVEQLARRIGYEITFRYDTHSPNTWLEITKPGTAQSIKGGQALAAVTPKSST